MKTIKDWLKGIASIDWSKRLSNLLAFFVAIAVFIAWPFLPIPTLHNVVFNLDLAGTLLTAVGCVASAAFVLGRDWRKAAESLAVYIVYALLVATILIFSSIPFSISLILVPGGVNLDIVLLFVSTVAFLRMWGAKGLREMFFELFFIVGIPLLLVDIYFGVTISVTAHIPYDSMILGGGGLRDGLNKMFFMILTFAFVYHLLVTKYAKEIAAMGVRFFGTQEAEGGQSAAPADPSVLSDQ
jgi:hypothetical protein